MLISELSKCVGCHVETVRYYEKVGLLSKPGRSNNGYRNYTDTHLSQLRFIRKLKHLGFCQTDIRELLSLVNSETNPCNDVRKLTGDHLKRVNNKIKEYEQIRLALEKMHTTCKNNKGAYCPILSELVE